MGNLCSKSSNKPDNFPGQGRVVGESEPTPSSAPVPPRITTNSPGRPLGGGSGGSDDALDPRSAAARAAEARAAKAQPRGGTLSANLAAQKRRQRDSLLAAASEEEQRARAVDEAAQARIYN